MCKCQSYSRALQKVTFKKTYFLKRRQTSTLHLCLGMKVTCRGRETLPSQVWLYRPPGTLLPRAVNVSLSKAQLLISNDFSTGRKRSLLSRFSEELPTFLLADKSNSWRLESKGITWAVKIATVTCFRHHLTNSSGCLFPTVFLTGKPRSQ